MIPKNRVVAPWLRAMNYEQGLEESGYYRKRTTREMGTITFTIWSIVIIAAALALILTGHHEQEMTAGVDRGAIMQRQEVSEAQHLMDKELWILREAKRDSGRHLDKLHMDMTR